MGAAKKTTKPFDTRRSIENIAEGYEATPSFNLVSEGREYHWSTRMERVGIIREGIPYESIEVLSKRLDKPVKSLLAIVGVPQTTYNKKKAEHSLLDRRDSELVLLLNELVDFGVQVFNHETEKFQRWLSKPNVSLGGHSPESMLDTVTGINEVKYCLNRLEYGNFA